MYVDKLLEFSDAQALTSAAASTNVVDTSVLRDLGIGEPLFVVVQVGVAFTNSESITPKMQGDDDDNWGGTDIFTMPAISAAASQVVGSKSIAILPPAATYFRYLRLYFTPSGTQATGKLDAFITNYPGIQYIYASGFSVA